jgi:hypothetical protein
VTFEGLGMNFHAAGFRDGGSDGRFGANGEDFGSLAFSGDRKSGERFEGSRGSERRFDIPRRQSTQRISEATVDQKEGLVTPGHSLTQQVSGVVDCDSELKMVNGGFEPSGCSGYGEI